MLILALLVVAGCKQETCVETAWYDDLDGDGYGDEDSVVTACAPPEGAADEAGDCDDRSRAVNPSATEICDGVDNDCDDAVDVGAVDADTYYTDADRDGYGRSDSPVEACAPAEGLSTEDGDCDDADDDFHPGAAEDDCTDGTDYNCDGSTGYADADGDGWPACQECDDADPRARPDATEICDGIDDDCDGEIDEGATATWYVDADGDGFGDPALAIVACEPPQGTVADATDCDDADAAYHPGADEPCDDPADYNCDGSTGYADADADGWAACEDCDDADPAANPGLDEICDGIDDDCDGTVDEADAVDAGTWYADTDGDGSGEAATGLVACDAPAGHVADPGDDCAPDDPTVYPGAPELCDGQRNDCDAASWTADDEAGHVSAESASGAWTDLTGTFAAGTSGSPASYTLPSDGTVWLCDGTWYARLVAPAGSAVTVEGRNGAALSVLDGADAGPVVTAEASASIALSGVTLQHGLGGSPPDSTSTYGGGVYATSATVALVDAILSENAANYGGGLAADGGTVTVEGTTFTSNVASYGGGLYAKDAAVTATGGVFDANTATSYGGGVYFNTTGSRDLAIERSEISENYASYGGGVYAYASGSGGVALDTTTLEGNYATHGGGLYLYGSGTASAQIADTTLADNVAGSYGGGVYATLSATATLTVDGSAFDANTAMGSYGGGLYLGTSGMATVTIQGDSAFTGNASGSYGGGIACSSSALGALALEDVEVSGNEAGDSGGGLWVNADSDIEMTRVSVATNEVTGTSSSRYGAGAFLYVDGGAATLIDCDVSDNTFASATSAYGGGVYASATSLSLSGTSVSGQEAYHGGGLYLDDGTALTLDDGSLISGNAATSGGGVYMGSSSTFECTGSTSTRTGFVANTATSRGGGAYLESTDAEIAAVECDTGKGGTENLVGTTASDVYVGGTTYAYADDATFACSGGACL